jgi:hypothetical protein
MILLLLDMIISLRFRAGSASGSGISAVTVMLSPLAAD